MNKTTKGGILLIIAGVLLLFNQLGAIPGQIFLYILAFGFIATYVLLGARKEYGNVGFLIPGVVLLTIAIYDAASKAEVFGGINPAFFFIGLALSFLAVFWAHTYWFKSSDHGDRFWPVYPTIGLLFVAAIVGLGTTGRWTEYLGMINYLWIIALIAVGGWLIYSSIRKNRTS